MLLIKGFKYRNLISDLTKKLVFWYFGKLVMEEMWSQPEIGLYIIIIEQCSVTMLKPMVKLTEGGANVKYIFEQTKLRKFASDLMQMFLHVYLNLTLGW